MHRGNSCDLQLIQWDDVFGVWGIWHGVFLDEMGRFLEFPLVLGLTFALVHLVYFTVLKNCTSDALVSWKLRPMLM